MVERIKAGIVDTVHNLIEAHSKAMPGWLYQQESDIRNTLQRRFIEREISLSQYLDEAAQLRFTGALIFKDFTEFRQVLSFDSEIPVAERKRTLNHERRHFQAATRAGFEDIKYGMQFTKDENTENVDVSSCFVTFRIPPNMDEEIAREGLRNTIEAPQKDMSPSDKRCLPVAETTPA